jgi:hypothetical protein
MAVDATKVAAGSPLVTGGILAAPVGTALPTDSDAVLNAAFDALGYATDDGLVPSGDAASTTDIFAWGGDNVLSVTDTPATKKYTFSLIEIFNEDVNNFIYGDANVTPTAAGSGQGSRLAIEDKGDEPGSWSLVFDMKHGDKRMRLVVPNGSVKVLGERAYVDSDVAGWECEVTCLADADGTYVYRYLENSDVAA